MFTIQPLTTNELFIQVGVKTYIFFPITQLVIGTFWKQSPHFNFFCMGLIEKKKIDLWIFWRRFRGSSRSVICAPTGTQWHSAASLGFENNAGKQRALWIYGKSLPCILRRLQIPFCEDTTEVLAGGTQVWNAEGKQHEGVKRHYRH